MGYDTDLSDAQWAAIEPLLPPPGRRGPPGPDRRTLLNAFFYALRAGNSWRLLPHDFPFPWQSAYWWFAKWCDDGTFARIQQALHRLVRISLGRDPEPSAAVMDSQSVKTAEGGAARGYDAGKKVFGRKRFLLVDTEGLLMACQVTAASVQDRAGGSELLDQVLPNSPRLSKVWVDGGFSGAPVAHAWGLHGVDVEVVKKAKEGFVVLPRRWVVERTNAWVSRWRRLGRDHERLTRRCEGWIWLSQVHLLSARLATAGTVVA